MQDIGLFFPVPIISSCIIYNNTNLLFFLQPIPFTRRYDNSISKMGEFTNNDTYSL